MNQKTFSKIIIAVFVLSLISGASPFHALGNNSAPNSTVDITSTSTVIVDSNATSTEGPATSTPFDNTTSTENTTSTATSTPTSTPETQTNTTSTATTTPAISIHLQIEAATSTLYNGNPSVEACSPATSTLPTLNAYCAIIASGLPNTWSSFGSDFFLDSVGGVGNDFVNGFYWLWFSNLEYGQTSLNAHILSPRESVLITLVRMPLKIAAATTTPAEQSTTTISVSQFGFDSSFNGIWAPAGSSTIVAQNASFETDANGNYVLDISSTTAITLFARKSGFLDSATITINPIPVQTTSTQPENTTPTDNNPQRRNEGGGGGVAITHRIIDIDKALEFLLGKQLEDGSFGSPLYTDWAAIAIAAGTQNSGKHKIISYLKSASDTSASAGSALQLNSGQTGSPQVTDYERRAMALMALNISPYDGTSINYIQKIVDFFDGTQIGDLALVNDDIFAIFPLSRAGYSTEDEIIKKTISFILKKQRDEGSWEGSIDLTAAGIQALSLADGIPGAGEAKARAKNFLASHQSPDGGFGTSFGTSWALQAISALGESGSNWLTSNNNPNDYLYSLQQNDGGIEPASTDLNTRIWATSYAIPGALNKPWASILFSFSKPAAPAPYGNSGGSSSASFPLADNSSTTAALNAPREIPVSASTPQRKEAPGEPPIENNRSAVKTKNSIPANGLTLNSFSSEKPKGIIPDKIKPMTANTANFNIIKNIESKAPDTENSSLLANIGAAVTNLWRKLASAITGLLLNGFSFIIR